MSGDKLNAGGAPTVVPQVVVIDDDCLGEAPRGPEKRAGPLGIVIETEDKTPIRPTIEAAAPPSPEALSERGRRAGTYSVASLAILVMVYWAVSLSEWVQDQFSHHSALGYTIFPFLIAALLFSIRWFWGEIAAWRHLVIADRLRADLSNTGQSQMDRDRFLSALRHLEATMEGPQRGAVATFLKGVSENRGANELRIILDHDVIYPMDESALSAIHRAAHDSFFLGLVSPTPITDTAAFIMRATAMIRGVAIAYGHRPGKLGLYSLMRRMIADVAILSSVMILMGRASSVVGRVIHQGSRAVSGALSTAGDPIIGTIVGAAGALAGDVTDSVAEEIADAVTAATRMAQLGLLAITVSRPVTLSVERKRDMSSRLREMALTFRRIGQQKRELEAKSDSTEVPS